jgi:hypothetical protein
MTHLPKVGGMINFYEKMPKKLTNQYHNPNFKQIGIKHPFRMLIIGSSGSGKTNCLLNLIYHMPDTFSSVTVITKNADEPLYNFLQQKLGDAVQIYEGLDDAPEVDSFDKTKQHLIVFDDLVTTKNQKAIEEYYIRARKLNCSLAYLSQSFFAIPKLIRMNANYLIIKKLGSLSDINRILQTYTLGIDRKQLKMIYEKATGTLTDFLLIDTEAIDEKKFRKNFSEFLDSQK